MLLTFSKTIADIFQHKIKQFGKLTKYLRHLIKPMSNIYTSKMFFPSLRFFFFFSLLILFYFLNLFIYFLSNSAVYNFCHFEKQH